MNEESNISTDEQQDLQVRMEIDGPFHEYRVIVNGYWVPCLDAARGNGIIRLILDHRFGCDIPDDERATAIVEFIANAMAVAGGYSCFGKNSQPLQPFKRRLTYISLNSSDDAPEIQAEAQIQ